MEQVVEADKKCTFSIDRGGTFTDIYAEVPGEPGFRVCKLLSVDPSNYDDAPREGIRRILEEVTGKSIPKDCVDTSHIKWIRMGTTVATNALLERKGERTALIVTKGFRDVLRIGNQSRPDIFDLSMKRPEMLYEQVVEVEERVRLVGAESNLPADSASTGNYVKGTTLEWVEILKKPNLEKLEADLKAVYDSGIRAVAVVLMHSYTFHEHEALVGQVAAKIGFEQISLSHEVMSMFRIVPRGFTATVDAYLTPLIKRYIENFSKGFDEHLTKNVRISFMRSDGGLAPVDRFRGSSSILSGPAGGVVGYAMTTDTEEKMPAIGFDMGGTSTDVSRYAGIYEQVYETVTAGITIQSPQLDINTVAAGGGSRLFFRSGLFVVGPESAGAHPGPVCYRKGGYLAITDANLLLGRLLPEYFPKIFGPTEKEPLDKEGTEKAFAELTAQINQWHAKQGDAKQLTPDEVAYGFIRVANETMCRPIRALTEARGHDPSKHVLACFGGAGGQHACAIARMLGMRRVFIHRFAGILSAYGLGLADMVEEFQEPCAQTYSRESMAGYLTQRIDALGRKATARLEAVGFDQGSIIIEAPPPYNLPYPYLDLRYEGTDTILRTKQPAVGSEFEGDYEGAFKAEYQREYGFTIKERAVVVDNIRVRAIGVTANVKRIPKLKLDAPFSERKVEYTTCYFEGGRVKTPVYQLSDLGADDIVVGPAIIIDKTSTIVIEPLCKAKITNWGDISIEVQSARKASIGTDLDPIQLSLFSNRFMSIAEQMGKTLQRTSISTNIKERLDFSCALFGPDGGLVANAPHLPVHLGAMQEAVRLLGADWKEGEVVVSNHPAAGGSHLPDITVITPVFKNGKTVFFVASRGHHADIGGISPGSMPPFSHTLAEEGACIKSFKLVKDGVFQEEAAERGTRNLRDNMSDLKAQVAANNKGIHLVGELIEEYGLEVVQAYMFHVQNNAEQAVREMLRTLSEEHGLDPVDHLYAEDFMDDGTPIRLKITIDRNDGTAVFDFAGTGHEIYGNLNAPRAVTMSAVIYCLRCLVRREIPLNQGCLNPVNVIIPEGSILAPSEEAGVVGGNVLTSQRVTDVILTAFKACANSQWLAGRQGCMNNFTFGNERMGYYETIAGGGGAGPDWEGESGVHSHMTNTRITDAEILERKYPVLLNEFSIRAGSGGRGLRRGGDGVVRELQFLQPLTVGILSERRAFAPHGLNGGEDGARGSNEWVKADGRVVYLGGKNTLTMGVGDRLRIITPGAGGYGKPTTTN
ncbi:5oxoprolinase [Acanthamoeba castellanii str. Neff]|uniref:5oxoprolinase n=1 Tax=Acanthamoeba castellanii (strain ATCC 30010 / Neff) TaxID=1257118 RepID=L8GF06_ACACF|nr:5oxoprolinase [Acanthamoeba castellanii str. Neff]ELR11567.1 5oxoprolinase [Acanthamoeba castellanii str. Neff]